MSEPEIFTPDPLIVPDPDVAPVGQGVEPEDAGDGDAEALPGHDPVRELASAGVAIARPRIVTFRTRQQLGLVQPRSVSHDIDTNPGGVAVHYGGDPAAVRDHAACEQRWRDWQRMHMAAPRGWNDIAYTGGYCSHGYAFAGRGVGARTAGQGTNDGNDRYYAVCWVNDRETPTTEALGALGWWIQQLRSSGSGMDVRAHRLFHSTSCPGDPLAAYAKQLDGKPLSGGVVVVPTARGVTLATQRAVHVPADGAWGSKTDAAVLAVRLLRGGHPTVAAIREAQHAVGTPVDGVWGPASKVAFGRTVRALQTAWRVLVHGLAVDGAWGPATDKAWASVRGQLKK